MKVHAETTSILQKLDEALKQFGNYSFDDKGANDVMDLETICVKLREYPVDVAQLILREVALTKGKRKDRPESLVQSLVVDLQDWGELFDDDDMVKLLNLEPLSR